ncbi:hypothetical protein Droror1_Dr00006823 [Drosera rotundifolia]
MASTTSFSTLPHVPTPKPRNPIKPILTHQIRLNPRPLVLCLFPSFTLASRSSAFASCSVSLRSNSNSALRDKLEEEDKDEVVGYRGMGLETRVLFKDEEEDEDEVVGYRGMGLETRVRVKEEEEDKDEVVRYRGIGLERRVFNQDKSWLTSLFSAAFLEMEEGQEAERRLEELKRRQIAAETEAWDNRVKEYHEMQRVMCEKGLAPNLPQIRLMMLDWFEPLKKAIEMDQKLEREKGRNVRAAYGDYITLLPADKMAVIIMHKMMALLLEDEDFGAVRVVKAAVAIGVAIEHEVMVHDFLERTKPTRKNKDDNYDETLAKEKEILRKRVNSLIKRRRQEHVAELVKTKETLKWDTGAQAKLGCRLIQLFIETAYVENPGDQSGDGPPDLRPAFRHRIKHTKNDQKRRFYKRYGVIECHPLILQGIEKSTKYLPIAYVPMLVPPRSWTGYNRGAHYVLPSAVMRTHGSRTQKDALKSVRPKQLQKVYEALDTLGITKWRINRRIYNVVETLWATGGNVCGLPDRENIPLPEKPSSNCPDKIAAWKHHMRKAKKTNRERHSLRCDTELRLSVAQRMKDEEGFYYPHNVDFRGRAYPMHPHLNHLNSDLCRGVLQFAEGRRLGKSGLRWLKIHLANLYGGGSDKLPYEGRVEFVDSHLEEIFDSATNPIDGNRWWLTAEDPFQFLAGCMDLSGALMNGSPHEFISHLPIHQDGSCNGLQHYAALGRDSMEAAAVNLVAGEKPADVYLEIAARVHAIMEKDSKKNPEEYPNALLAKLLVDKVDRKLVKQTVMTSVYGVTFIGARDQIKRRLEEKGYINDDDNMLFRASCYSAKVTFAALGEIFQAARSIMDWLGDCAKIIASTNEPVRWTSPIGLPIVQPYCKYKGHNVRTTLQLLALRKETEMVEARRQRTAFPPNFVHSLDGSHMMMTAVACREAGLNFAGVHDSFWTHACDVDMMNQILREKFVELYDEPILENLLESFRTTYPDCKFPHLPDRGDFDLTEVLKSQYFFN